MVSAVPPSDLPYEEGTFDVALAQLVVHFIAEPVAGLPEMAGVTSVSDRPSTALRTHAVRVSLSGCG